MQFYIFIDGIGVFCYLCVTDTKDYRASVAVTRYKIITRRCRYDLRKYSFCNPITNIWNSLPNDVVNASSLNVFKNRLDNHWINQDVMYDWHADISGTGSRSNIVS